MTPKKKRPPQGRYDLAVVTAEIESTRHRLGLSVKEAAAECGILRTVWYKKRDQDGSTFDFEDISRIAAVFGEHCPAGRAPTGWPYIPWSEGERFDRWMATFGRTGGDEPPR